MPSNIAANAIDVVAVGPWDRGEFALTLPSLAGSGDWPLIATVGEALASIGQCSIGQCSTTPELLLLAAPTPGYCNEREVLELQRLAPLLRVIVVAGTWCEGELRTGRPLPGALRMYWYELAAWWDAALHALSRGAAAPWSLPSGDLFAGPRVGTLHEATMRAERAVAIDAADYSVFETLADALPPLGWSAVWRPRHRPELWDDDDGESPLAAGIWDGGQLSETEFVELRQFCERLAAPVVTLLDFPRAEHVGQIRQAGATAVIAKPYRVAALANTLCAVDRANGVSA